MLRRVTFFAAAVCYAICFLAGIAVFFWAEGTFSFSSRYFWAYTALPPLFLLLHGGAAVLLAWKPERAAPAVVAVEVFSFVAAVTGFALFGGFWSATFRWVMLAAILRVSVAAVVVYYASAPFQKDRWLVVTGSGVGLVLGLTWLLSLQPPAEGTHGAIAPGTVVKVWQKPDAATAEDEAAWSAGGGLSLPGGGHLVLHSTPPTLLLQFPEAVIGIYPVAALPQISLDGFWVTPLNRVGLGFTAGSPLQGWSDKTARYASLRFGSADHTSSRLSQDLIAKRFVAEPLSAELYVREEPQTGAVDVVALTDVRQTFYVRQATAFEIVVQPYAGQAIRLPGLGDVKCSSAPGEGEGAAHLVNVQGGQAVLYVSAKQNSGPFKELARSDHFGDALVVEGVDKDRALLIYFPDWRRQALPGVSPSAGEPLYANALELSTSRVYLPPPQTGTADVLHIRAAWATTEDGTGRPVVSMAKGIYANRLAVRLVAKQDDYSKALQGIQLWPLPVANGAAP